MTYCKQIYAIQHNVTRRMYIGSSMDVDGRYRAHIYALRKGKHPVEDMQTDYDHHGEDYSVFLLGTISSRTEKRAEYEWMARYRSHVRGYGYNYRDRAAVRRYIPDKTPYKDGLPNQKEGNHHAANET